MNIDLAGANKELLQLDILELLMKYEVGAELRNVKLKIFFGEDGRLALVIDDCHQFAINLAFFTKQECN